VLQLTDACHDQYRHLTIDTPRKKRPRISVYTLYF